jgi:hypothetical protein
MLVDDREEQRVGIGLDYLLSFLIRFTVLATSATSSSFSGHVRHTHGRLNSVADIVGDIGEVVDVSESGGDVHASFRRGVKRPVDRGIFDRLLEALAHHPPSGRCRLSSPQRHQSQQR